MGPSAPDPGLICAHQGPTGPSVPDPAPDPAPDLGLMCAHQGPTGPSALDWLQNPRPVDSGPCSRPPVGAHLWKILFHVCRHWYRSAITSRTRFSKALPASKMPWEGYRRLNRVTRADTTYPPSTPSQNLPAPWADDVAASGETIQWCPSVGRWGGRRKG